MRSQSLPVLVERARACRECDLPHDPRPVFQAGEGASVVVIGQAPGRRVHDTGVPWDDRSGDRLRDWLGVDRDTFLDPEAFALLPMGFCYPGTGTSGDLPPRPECAPLWHPPLLAALGIDPDGGDGLVLLLGQYALGRYLPERRTVTAAVQAWQELLPSRMALPHPSPRNNRWLARNPWFEAEAVPALRTRVAQALG